MNKEELTAQLVELVKDTKAFVSTEAPSYFQEVIAWTQFAGILAFLATAFVLALLYLTLRIAAKNNKEHGDITSSDCIRLTVVGIAALFTSVLGAVPILNALKCWVAPKAFLVDHVRGLL